MITFTRGPKGKIKVDYSNGSGCQLESFYNVDYRADSEFISITKSSSGKDLSSGGIKVKITSIVGRPSDVPEEVAQWLVDNFFFDGNLSTYISGSDGLPFDTYTELQTEQPAGEAGRFAFVENSEGSKWLPGSLGGTYRIAGWYYDNGSNWVSKIDEVLEHLDQGLQSVTDFENSTTNDIIQLGGRMVSPEFEVSGASLDLSQRIKAFAFGSFTSFIDTIQDERSLILKKPFDENGTNNIVDTVLGVKFNIIAQAIDTDVFTGSIITSESTSTIDLVTEVIYYKFQDAGKQIKLRVIADNGLKTFDLYGTSADPFLRFTTVSGLNTIILGSPIPSPSGVTFTSTIETEDGSPLNILGDDVGAPFSSGLGNHAASDFNAYLAVDSYPYSEEAYRAVRLDKDNEFSTASGGEKTSIVASDRILVEDSENSDQKIWVQVGNLLQAAPIQEDDDLNGTENDYALSDINATNTLRVTLPSGNVNLTGIVAPSPVFPKGLIISNADTSNTLKLLHNNAGSLAANRFLCPNNISYQMKKNSGVVVNYDTTSERWRVVGIA